MVNNYEHFIPATPQREVFSKVKSFLITKDSIEKFSYFALQEVRNKESLSLQLVLTGKDKTKDSVVGFSVAWDATSSYYIPLAHDRDSASTHESGVTLLKRLVVGHKILLYGAVLGLRFLAELGLDVKSLNFVDVQLCVFLADTNIKNPEFNFATQHFLGDTISSEVFVDYNLYYIQSKDCYKPICLRCVGIFLLYAQTARYLLESGYAGEVENRFLYALMRCEDSDVRLAPEYVKDIFNAETLVLEELQEEVFRLAGRQFNLNAPAMLLQVLRMNGIWVDKTDEKTLLTYTRNTPSRLVECIVKYSKLNKYLSAYVKPLFAEGKKEVIHFHYKPFNASTCRLAGSADGKNVFFAKFNVQSFVKPDKADWYVHDYHGEGIKDGEVVILRWRFSQVDKSDKVVVGYSQEHNLRNALIAPENCFIVSTDYDSEELRVLANYSKEPEWVETFLHSRDLHRQKAEFFWGKDNYNEQKRDAVKALNYGISYGLTPFTLAWRLGVSQAEAEVIYKSYMATIPCIRRFQQQSLAAAVRDGVIYNYFGLPRRVRWWLTHSEKHWQKYGQRVVLNTSIQSVGATLLKIAILKMQQTIFDNSDWGQDISFMTTVHDEVNCYVTKSRLTEGVAKIKGCMEMTIPSWEVPFTVGIKIGDRWGRLFPFTSKSGVLIPLYKEL